ncbi:MAG: metal-dependent transcriptional regulator [Eubacteriales bacterium]
MTNVRKLTASHIRYLLVLQKLSESGAGIRSVKLASELGVTRPSVHTMLGTLCDMNLVRKEAHGEVDLTPAGRQTARRYDRYYETVFLLLTAYISEDSSTKGAILSLLAEMSEETLEQLCANRTREEQVSRETEA